MGIRANMAMLTRHPKLQGRQRQPAGGYCIGRMATKAGLGFLARQLSSHSFFHGVWSNSFLAHCDIEAIDGWVEAHQTVVELAIAFEDPGLPTGAEAPPNGHGDRTGAVRDRVGALVADSFDRVGVRSLAKNHSWMRLQ